jgi:hypothetical protein
MDECDVVRLAVGYRKLHTPDHKGGCFETIGLVG